MPSGSVPSYSAAKGALVQLTKSMAIELAPFNIQVNAIAPGRIETDMTAPVKTKPLYQEIMMASRAKEPFNDSDWILAFTVRVRSHHGAT
jgi:NAD(P)-dependent dehydrogenase (short-subunit alcohol dehydrogenase family)